MTQNSPSCHPLEDIISPAEIILYKTLTRRDVRSLILHLLYALEMRDYQDTPAGIIENYNEGFNLDIPIDGEIRHMLDEIVRWKDTLDQSYIPLLTNWRFDRLSVCTKLILRIAIWELTATQTEPSIIINEAVELGKCFAEHDAFRFINGILDKMAEQLGKKNHK